MVEEETFFAWLDGELPPEDAVRVEAKVAADPELSKQAAEHRAMTAGLRGAFGTIATQPVPERLRAGLSDKDTVISLADARAKRNARRAQPIWVQAAALAAALAIGIFAGDTMNGERFGGSSDLITSEDGRLVASAGLGNALDTHLASAPADGGVRIGLTFRDKAGAICRTFQNPSSSGIACHEQGTWRIHTLFQDREGPAQEYRMAGTNAQLMEAVDASIDGDPFDAAQERAAMEGGWRR